MIGGYIMNINLFKERINGLTEEEIRQAFDEIIDYNKKGILPIEALVRKIRNEYAEEINDKLWDMGCILTSNEILYEIAKRHYSIKE
jgi:hypothetical protein